MGDTACRCGFSFEMYGLRSPNYDSTEDCGEKYERIEKRLEITF